jgi:putative membrane protein
MSFTIAISKDRVPVRKNAWLLMFTLVFAFVWSNSYVGTTDIANWLLENTLTFIFVSFLIVTYKRHQFSDLSYLLVCVYLCLHVYGSKYTYAENPFGYWLKIFFIYPEIIMIVLYILVLVFY